MLHRQGDSARQVSEDRCRVLLIEDSRSDAVLFQHTLHEDPLGLKFEITVAESLARGLELARVAPLDVILLDLNLPDSCGFETFHKLREAITLVPIIILTAVGGERLARQAVEDGAQDFLFKHRLDPYWIAQSIRHAIGRQKLLQRLRAAEASVVEAANRANQAKTEFLAAMSHEIRTPIGAIMMGCDILLAGVQDEAEQRDMARIIHRNGEHLLHLTTDFLDLSKIEAGCLTIERTDLAPAAFIDDVAAGFAAVAAQKGVRLTFEPDAELPDALTTDPTRLRQILGNLLSNAVKFTSSGQVIVRARRKEWPGKARLAIEVEDTGIGIPEEARRGLFRPFTQADAAIHRKYGGTGLGLQLSRRLAEALGGELLLTRSQPGVGSLFTLYLPLRADSAHGGACASGSDAVRPLGEASEDAAIVR